MKKFSFLLLLLTTTACVYKNMYHFENNDLQWVNSYPLNDTIRLETSNGVDLLCMNKKEIYDNKSPFLENEGQDIFGDYNAIAYYEGFLIHKLTKHKIWISITKNSNNGIYASFYIGGRFCFDIESDYRNLNKQGSSIKDTVIIDDLNSKYGNEGPKNDDFEYYKWSKKDGLIEYKLRDGTMYPKQ